MDFMKDYTFANARIVTCVSPSDIKFFDNYRDLIDLNSRVYQAYNSTENYAGEFEKQYTVPITLIREDREAYIDKRVEVYRKRLRLATDAMLKSRKAVLMFRADNGLDKATALRDTVVNGDGRLCIEVNINSNMAVTYYGGTFLQEEYLPTILSM
jgi:hypothetical protein